MRRFLGVMTFAGMLVPTLAFAAGGGGEGSIFWWVGYMPIQFLVYLTVIAAIFIGVNYALKKIGKGIPAFPQAILLLLGSLFFFEYVLTPPIPSALLYTYMGLVTLVVFLFISSTERSWTEFKRPIINTLLAETKRYKQVRNVSFIAVPLLVGFGTWNFMVPKFDEPVELRTVHPAPPASTTVQGKSFTLQTARNPFRVKDDGEYLEVGKEAEFFKSNPFADNAPKYLQYVREGGGIFFQNSHFCHGDNLNGRGMFAFAFNPIPANFVDPGTIAQLQETFVFWRIAKGGPGLPTEGFPWASAMPPWEEHLTSDEIWKVAMFEYWHTEFFPRTFD